MIQSSGLANESLRLFVCGDVMIGRGIDQILPRPCPPGLYESHATSALDYVRLAERANGKIKTPVTLDYIWGAALAEWADRRPDVRLINLETSITRSEDYAPKGINYRVSRENAACLRAAGIDCCSLANNHVLDWSTQGLRDTLSALRHMHIASAGAGHTQQEARAPAILPVAGKGRVRVSAVALPTSGVPEAWAAGPNTPGVHFMPDLSSQSLAQLVDAMGADRRVDDVAVVSIHWGGNWGYEVPAQQRDFARRLIDQAGVSIVHGHSSHHPKAIEIYKNRVIFHGCGDFMNDYEGIGGQERYRSDLVLMYFIDVDVHGGDVLGLNLVPLRLVRFRLERPSREDTEWLLNRLDYLCRPLGLDFQLQGSSFAASWDRFGG